MTLAAAIPAGVVHLRIPEVQRERQELPLREVRGQRGAAQDRQARLNPPPAHPPGLRAAAELRQPEPGGPGLQRQARESPGKLCQGQPGLWGDQHKVERPPEQRGHCLERWGDRKWPLQNQQAIIETQEPLVQLLRQNLATSGEDIPDPTQGKRKV